MFIEFLLQVFGEDSDRDAIVWRGDAHTYGWLLERIEYWRVEIERHEVQRGAVVAIEAEFSPNSIALFLALIEHACVLVPLTVSVAARRQEFLDIAQAEVRFVFAEDDSCDVQRVGVTADHEYYRSLRERSSLFSIYHCWLRASRRRGG